jgi:hypothetical protein
MCPTVNDYFTHRRPIGMAIKNFPLWRFVGLRHSGIIDLLTSLEYSPSKTNTTKIAFEGEMCHFDVFLMAVVTLARTGHAIRSNHVF